MEKRHVYPRAAKAFEVLKGAIRLFEALINEDPGCETPNFYQARNLLREGESEFQAALKNARKLLGPLPEYVTEDYRKWREEFVESSGILARGSELESLREDIRKDEFIREWIAEEDLDLLLERNFGSQQEGKRRLSNIKVRIVLDRLFRMLDQAKDLQARALQKQRSRV